MCSKFFASKKQLKDHIDMIHRVSNYMADTSSDAEKIVDGILSSNDKILAVSIIDKKRGNILAAKSRQSFKDGFRVTSDGDRYGGTLAIATLSVVNEVRDIFGEAQAIITIHDDCKLTLLPIPSFDILVGLVVERSVNVEDDKIVNKIERLVADTIVKPQ
jgi:hypothetical protein